MYLSKALKCGCLKPICGKQVGNLWGRLALTFGPGGESFNNLGQVSHHWINCIIRQFGLLQLRKYIKIGNCWVMFAHIKHIRYKESKISEKVYSRVFHGKGGGLPPSFTQKLLNTTNSLFVCK